MVKIKVKSNTPQKLDPGDNPTFEKWCSRVDSLLSIHTGLGRDDLPDQPWQRWYEQRLRPIRAANRALRKADAAW